MKLRLGLQSRLLIFLFEFNIQRECNNKCLVVIYKLRKAKFPSTVKKGLIWILIKQRKAENGRKKEIEHSF